jgi:hypothetical protein
MAAIMDIIIMIVGIITIIIVMVTLLAIIMINNLQRLPIQHNVNGADGIKVKTLARSVNNKTHLRRLQQMII